MRNFVIADTVHPLLGFDFLENFDLSIDCKARQISDSLTERKIKVSPSSSSVNVVINNVQLPSGIDSLLKKYPYVTSPHDNENA